MLWNFDAEPCECAMPLGFTIVTNARAMRSELRISEYIKGSGLVQREIWIKSFRYFTKANSCVSKKNCVSLIANGLTQ